jgi:hypothetical protein
VNDRFPFDANGNLLPGLAVVEGRIVASEGQATHSAPPEVPVAEVTVGFTPSDTPFAEADADAPLETIL